MNVPEIVERVSVCVPVQQLLLMLIDRGCVIIKQELRDYHFNELHFEVKCEAANIDIQLPAGITHSQEGVYNCKCHWSTVKIIS